MKSGFRRTEDGSRNQVVRCQNKENQKIMDSEIGKQRNIKPEL